MDRHWDRKIQKSQFKVKHSFEDEGNRLLSRQDNLCQLSGRMKKTHVVDCQRQDKRTGGSGSDTERHVFSGSRRRLLSAGVVFLPQVKLVVRLNSVQADNIGVLNRINKVNAGVFVGDFFDVQPNVGDFGLLVGQVGKAERGEKNAASRRKKDN